MGTRGLLPEGRYANCANGYRIHYLDEGEGDVVVFLHGSGPGASGYSNFKGNYPAMAAAGYRCIVPDHIGYGFSDKPDDVEHPLSFFVECIKQTLDEIGVARCSIVGNSLGGAIALGLALDYPELIDKLILMAPGGLSELHEYQQMPGMQKMFQVFGSGEPVTHEVMKDLFATGLMYDPVHATDDLVRERMQVMELMNGHVMATMKVPVLTDRLPELDCPVLGFWGINERMMPESGIMALAKNTHQLRLILVSECGHWVMVEHRDMFNRNCLDFLHNG
ncbi:3-oxoacyl-ACP reductase [Kineobactrum sediminis]|uniref:3-oxoacyl-ACP reductase n=1 Tax=Kineobactrum sediminis TaxID=1905677 RepID=A0A2N5Y409_9GAMM|nr:alpha/beta hydrolase [Kineobactrum sediminis]PLW83122.1 3-oxoacyl-ACP reductase [Kineobactrum sediminis]